MWATLVDHDIPQIMHSMHLRERHENEQKCHVYDIKEKDSFQAWDPTFNLARHSNFSYIMHAATKVHVILKKYVVLT